jgi:hypothetical protein
MSSPPRFARSPFFVTDDSSIEYEQRTVADPMDEQQDTWLEEQRSYNEADIPNTSYGTTFMQTFSFQDDTFNYDQTFSRSFSCCGLLNIDSGTSVLVATAMSPVVVVMPFACAEGGYVWFLFLVIAIAVCAQQSITFLATSSQSMMGHIQRDAGSGRPNKSVRFEASHNRPRKNTARKRTAWDRFSMWLIPGNENRQPPMPEPEVQSGNVTANEEMPLKKSTWPNFVLSYALLAEYFLGSSSKYAAAGAVCLQQISIATITLYLFGQLMGEQIWGGQKALIIFASGFVLPLCFFEKLSSLKYLSNIVNALTLFYTVSILLISWHELAQRPTDTASWHFRKTEAGERDTSGWLQCFTVILFGFASNPFLLTIYNETEGREKGPSNTGALTATVRSSGISTVVALAIGYILCGILPAAVFGNGRQVVLLWNYGGAPGGGDQNPWADAPDGSTIATMRTLLTLTFSASILLNLPIVLHPVRQCLDLLWFGAYRPAVSWGTNDTRFGETAVWNLLLVSACSIMACAWENCVWVMLLVNNPSLPPVFSGAPFNNLRTLS